MQAFESRIRENTATYNSRALQYTSGGGSLQVTFGGEFRVNGTIVATEYRRFDSPYANCPRKPSTITIAHDGHVLELDFYRAGRTIEKRQQ